MTEIKEFFPFIWLVSKWIERPHTGDIVFMPPHDHVIIKRDYAVNIITLFAFLLFSSVKSRLLLFIFDVILTHAVSYF